MKKINTLSLISLITSVLGYVFWSLIFVNGLFIIFFICCGLASVILPIIAKKARIERGTGGKWMEIVAIVLGGNLFSMIIVYFTKLPVFVEYLGWIIDIIVYRSIKELPDYRGMTSSKTITSKEEFNTPAPPAEERSSSAAPADTPGAAFLEKTAQSSDQKLDRV